MHDVELWQKPLSGRTILPIIKVEEKIFVYNRDGLHTYPAETMSRPSRWQRLGETALGIAEVCARAFEIFAERFAQFDPNTANPVQYARALASALVPNVQNHPIWGELENQSWNNVRIDINGVLDVNSQSSRNSSFGSRSYSSTS